MAKLLRVQKQIILLVVSFVLSSVYRTFTGAWPFTKADAASRVTLNRTHGGFLLTILRPPSTDRKAPGRSLYALEVTESFPFLHVLNLTVGEAHVALVRTARVCRVTNLSGLLAQSAGCTCSSPSSTGAGKKASASNPNNSNGNGNNPQPSSSRVSGDYYAGASGNNVSGNAGAGNAASGNGNAPSYAGGAYPSGGYGLSCGCGGCGCGISDS